MSGLAHAAWAPALLGAWAVLALLVAAAWLRARVRLARLGAGRPGAGGARDLVLGGALLALALALLGPQLGTRRVALPADGIDLVVLIDVSRSMDAADAPPSRLARARGAARAVLRGLAPGDRAALAVFAGRGALLTPLTHDALALVELLPALDTEWMSDRGSRLAAGLEAALGAFDPESPRPRIVLALGDGERGQLVPDSLRDELLLRRVRVVAGAIGSEAGAVLMGPAGPLRDWSGEAVVTRRETRGFERLARASGGALVVSDAFGALDAGALLAAARSGLEPGPGGMLVREVPATWSALPAALAFALLLGEVLAGAGFRVAAGVLLRRGSLAALALLALAANPGEREVLEAEVARRPDDARLLIALGVARAEAGDLEEARHALAAAVARARDPEEIALASYDLGVALLGLGDFAGARDAFFDALAHAPDDRDAKFDLEWALRAQEREPQAPPADASQQPPREPDASAASDAPAGGERDPTPPSAETGAAESEAEPQPGRLDAEAVERWLESVRDVPPPAWRHAGETGPAARSGPQW